MGEAPLQRTLKWYVLGVVGPLGLWELDSPSCSLGNMIHGAPNSPASVKRTLEEHLSPIPEGSCRQRHCA